ncbi:MAG: TVP38/TMEM64 family protein [Pseudomonadota bacterium]|nr:TVP38/TMEM64 family protein [Pseudomonadota bacterium]
MTRHPQRNREKSKKAVLPSLVLCARIAATIIVGGAILATLMLDLPTFFTMDTLKTHHFTLTGWVEAQKLKAALAYVALYILLVLFLIPGPFFATLVGGFLFGPLQGTLLTVIGATSGAVFVFLITKSAAGNLLRKWAGNRAHNLAAGFQKNALSYMFVLRLIPLFPFSLVTVCAALLEVKLATFFIATSLGMIPAVYFVSLAGASISTLLETNEALTPANIFTPQAIAAIAGLALLSMLPLLYKKVRR